MKSQQLEENNMNSSRLKARARARRAYFLGGGGVNEPTPGKPKYEKEDSDSIRDKEDKQMVGEPLDTGSEGLHPGDLETKKKLLRAEKATEMKKEADDLEERAMKRRAYWLGGGGINEPTPGKPKYEKEDSDSIRDKEDKQMVGQPLDTGSDGMFPGDLEAKKKLLRAKLRARFTKVADDNGQINKAASHWDIFAGDKLILTASGQEIYDDELNDNWDYLQSKAYGLDVMNLIRESGFDRAAYLLKGAAEPVAPVAPDAPVPAPAPEAPVAPAAPVEPVSAPVPPAPEAKDVAAPKPAENEKQQKVDKALNAMEEKLAEIRELMSGSAEDLVDVGVNIEGKDGGAKAPALDKLLSSKEELMKVEALMDLSADELAEVSNTLENMDKVADEKRDTVLKFADQALADGEYILSQANEILTAVKSTKKDEKVVKAEKLLADALKVRAENRVALLARAEMYGEDMAEDVEEPECVHDVKSDEHEVSEVSEVMDAEDEMFALSPEQETELKKLLEQEKLEGHQLAKDKDVEKDEEDEDEEEEEDKEDEKEDKDEEDEDKDEEDANDMGCEECGPVMASRKAEREKIVAMAADKIMGKYQLDLGPAQNVTEKTFFEAHPGGHGTVTELTDTKTPEAKVETISEVHEKMREVAESGPRNVREAAALIQESIVKGVFAAKDLDNLVAEGKVDSTAASYWKQYFSQAPDAGSFGADMSKEFGEKKKEANDKNYRLRLRRAYDVGMQAQDKGLVANSRAALESYVDEIMSFDDAAFESTKRVVAAYKNNKNSVVVPRVGVDSAAQPMEVLASTDETAGFDDQFSILDWK